MRFLGFAIDIVSVATKTVLTPVAIVKDAVNIVVGVEPDATKTLLESAGNDLEDAVDEIIP